MVVYDVISVGSASLDIFIRSKSKQITFISKRVCLPIGSKILLDNLITEIGGAGVNTSIAFSRLGLRSGFLGKVGNDISGKHILQELAREKVNFLSKTAKEQTGCSIILSGLKKNRTILTYKGCNNSLRKVDIPKIQTRWLYFGTLLGESWKTQLELARTAKQKGIKILFNPSLYLAEKGTEMLHPMLSASSILILNKEEAEALTSRKGTMNQLLQTLQVFVPLVVITDGPRGAWAYNGIKTYSIKPKDVPTKDPTGAGDAFASAFLAAIILDKDISIALQWGAAEANSVIQYFGATNKLLDHAEIISSAKSSGILRRKL